VYRELEKFAVTSDPRLLAWWTIFPAGKGVQFESCSTLFFPSPWQI